MAFVVYVCFLGEGADPPTLQTVADMLVCASKINFNRFTSSAPVDWASIGIGIPTSKNEFKFQSLNFPVRP